MEGSPVGAQRQVKGLCANTNGVLARCQLSHDDLLDKHREREKVMKRA